MSLVEWAGVGLFTGAVVLGLLAWGFWRPLGAVWAAWFTFESVALSLFGIVVAMGRFPRPDDQTIIVALVLLAVAVWHVVMVVTTPLSR